MRHPGRNAEKAMDEGSGAWIGTNQAPRKEWRGLGARWPDQAGGIRQRSQGGSAASGGRSRADS